MIGFTLALLCSSTTTQSPIFYQGKQSFRTNECRVWESAKTLGPLRAGCDDVEVESHRERGKANQRLMKSISQENRIAALTLVQNRSLSQEAELKGLMAKNFEEQYNPSDFSEEHVNFKQSHNDAFSALISYCQRKKRWHDSDEPINVFYLDGPDAKTSQTLKKDGFSLDRLYVTNRHKSSCQALIKWGLSSDNVALSDACNSLQREKNNFDGGKFRDLDFGAFYFDVCGGFAPQIVGMIEGALTNRPNPQYPLVVGFSIVGGNRDVVDKEVEVIQSLVRRAKEMGMRIQHVFDDPARYGVSENLKKVNGNTLTTWFVLEPLN